MFTKISLKSSRKTRRKNIQQKKTALLRTRLLNVFPVVSRPENFPLGFFFLFSFPPLLLFTFQRRPSLLLTVSSSRRPPRRVCDLHGDHLVFCGSTCARVCNTRFFILPSGRKNKFLSTVTTTHVAYSRRYFTEKTTTNWLIRSI